MERGAKEPWKGIEVSGDVEADFLYATLLGRHLLPFGYTKLDLVVLPLEIKVGQHLSAEIDEIDKLVKGILSQPFNPKSW